MADLDQEIKTLEARLGPRARAARESYRAELVYLAGVIDRRQRDKDAEQAQRDREAQREAQIQKTIAGLEERVKKSGGKLAITQLPPIVAGSDTNLVLTKLRSHPDVVDIFGGVVLFKKRKDPRQNFQTVLFRVLEGLRTERAFAAEDARIRERRVIEDRARRQVPISPYVGEE